jgi:hypothetical protein
MRYALVSAVVFVGCLMVLAAARDGLALPAGVASIMDDIGRIF